MNVEDLPVGLCLATTDIPNKLGEHYGILDIGNVLGGAPSGAPILYQLTPSGVVGAPIDQELTIVDWIGDIDAARARFTQALQRPQYDLVTNNCEHFARYVAYGRRESSQVWIAAFGAALLTVLVARSLAQDQQRRPRH